MERKAYPTDVSDAEWALVAPYLTLMTEDAPQRDFSLREVFNGLRWMVRSGSSWRMMPHDLPPWHVDYQQTQRWIKATQAKRQPMRPKSMGSSSKWSNSRRRREALCCCHADGLSNEVSAGCRAFAVWRATMNDCL